MSNIVRGNVIGTSLKPELNLLKATNLTPEEQAEVRKNIGANTLIVGAKTTHSPNMDASLGRSTHTPAEIYEHVQNGGTAMFRDDGIYYGLSFSDESTALFCSLFDDNSATVFEVYNDMVYRYDHSFVTDSSFREALEEVRGSVESANKSDTHLVRVNSRLDPDTDERTYETVNFDWDELVDAVNSGKHIYCQVHDMDMLEEDDFVVIEEYALEYFSDEENFATFMKPFLPGYIVRTVEVYFDGSVSCLERTSSVTTDKLLQDPGVPADAEAVGDALATGCKVIIALLTIKLDIYLLIYGRNQFNRNCVGGIITAFNLDFLNAQLNR